jgi:hypothetical protein
VPHCRSGAFAAIGVTDKPAPTKGGETYFRTGFRKEAKINASSPGFQAFIGAPGIPAFYTTKIRYHHDFKGNESTI